MKNILIFLSEKFHFLLAKFSVYLYRHVFVMGYHFVGFVVRWLIFFVFFFVLISPGKHILRVIIERSASPRRFIRVSITYGPYLEL